MAERSQADGFGSHSGPRSALKGVKLAYAILSEAAGVALISGALISAFILPERCCAYGDYGVAIAAFTGAGALFLALVACELLGGADLNPLLTWARAIRLQYQAGIRAAEGENAALWLVGAQIAGGFGGIIATHAFYRLDAVQEPVAQGIGPLALVAALVSSWAATRVAVGNGREREAEDRYRGTNRAFFLAMIQLAAALASSGASFANPALTVARTITSTQFGLSPVEACVVLLAETAGMALALYMRWRLATLR